MGREKGEDDAEPVQFLCGGGEASEFNESFTGVAGEQPTISLQLKQLEDYHGAKLYRRMSKGIEITEAGRSFLRQITLILEQVAELEGRFNPPAAKVVREVLRVGGTFS